MTKGAPKKGEPAVAGDPRLGAVAEQLTLAKALGLKHVVVAVNKMDGKPSAWRGHLPGSGPGGAPRWAALCSAVAAAAWAGPAALSSPSAGTQRRPGPSV